MTDYKQHPITPPPELVEQWLTEWMSNVLPGTAPQYIAIQAARWGSDQELEACCGFLQELLAPSEWITGLRAARCPKPPSLKEQALSELDSLENMGACNADTIRRELEQLAEDIATAALRAAAIYSYCPVDRKRLMCIANELDPPSS